MSTYLNEKDGHFYMNCRPDGKHGRRLNIKLGDGITTKEQADDFEQMLMAAARKKRAGILNAPVDLTVKGLWAGYLDYITVNRAVRTSADVALAGRHISRLVGTFRVTDMSPEVIEVYKRIRISESRTSTRKDTCKKPVKPPRPISNRTINKELSWLGGMLNWCRRVHRLDVPVFHIEKLKYHRPIPVILTPQEVAELIKAAEPFYRAFFGLLYLAGLRSNEARKIKWEDIDYGNRCAIVLGKGGKQRIVPVPDWLFAALEEIRPAGGKDGKKVEGYVFMNPNTGKLLVDARCAMRRAAKKAGITKRVYPHLLRHSFGAHSLEADVGIRTLQVYMGHANIEMTQWYTQVVTESLRRASHKLTDLSPLTAPTIEIDLPPEDTDNGRNFHHD